MCSVLCTRNRDYSVTVLTSTSWQRPTGLMVKASVSGCSRLQQVFMLAEDSGFDSQVGRFCPFTWFSSEAKHFFRDTVTSTPLVHALHRLGRPDTFEGQ